MHVRKKFDYRNIHLKKKECFPYTNSNLRKMYDLIDLLHTNIILVTLQLKLTVTCYSKNYLYNNSN